MATVHQDSCHSSNGESVMKTCASTAAFEEVEGVHGWGTLRWQLKRLEGKTVGERTEWTEVSKKFETNYKK